MSATNPLLNDPHASTHGEGNYGVRLTRFVPSGAPGGYSSVEFVYLFPSAEERDAYAQELKRKHGSRRKDAPVIDAFDSVPQPPRLYMVIEEYPPLTIDEFRDIAEDQRQQRRRKRAFRALLLEAAELAARGTDS